MPTNLRGPGLKSRAVHLRHLLQALLLAGALMPMALGCRPARGPLAESVAPRPRNTAQIAEQIVQARVGTIVYLERLRGQPLAGRLVQLGGWQELFEGTNLDLVRDFDRLFVAATGTSRRDQALLVAQHKRTEVQVRAAVEALIAKSSPPGAWLPMAAVPSARVIVRGQPRIVALPEPGFVVVLPESLAMHASKFQGTGGFADPQGRELAISRVLNPHESLRFAKAPRVPPTVSHAQVTYDAGYDGGVDLKAQGWCPDAAQAQRDAAQLTSDVEKATTLKVGFVKLRMFKPVVFRAEGNEVKGELHLTLDEIDKLVTMSRMLNR